MEQSEIKDWVRRNDEGLSPSPHFSDAELDHLAICMHHIQRWYYESFPLGSFLSAVVRNDLCEACFRADDVNRRALYLYALFLANKIPSDWREKANPTPRSADTSRLKKRQRA